MTKEVWERRLTALKEMGCDAIRTSIIPICRSCTICVMKWAS